MYRKIKINCEIHIKIREYRLLETEFHYKIKFLVILELRLALIFIWILIWIATYIRW